MYQRILVPLDGSVFAETAISSGIGLAQRWGASLALVTVAMGEAHPDRPGGFPEIAPESGLQLARDQATAYIEGATRRVREAGFEGDLDGAVLPAGNIWRALVAHAQQTRVELVVMTTHGLGPLRRAWLGSVTDSFVRHSPVPVLLIPPGGRPKEDPSQEANEVLRAGPSGFSKILFPMDGSAEAEKMLEVAAPLADDGAVFILFRSVAPFIPGGSPYLPHLVRQIEIQEEVKNAAWGYLEGVSDRIDAHTTETRVVTAPAAAVPILKAVEEERADLIAISTTGRGGPGRLVLGSVADKVVRGSPIPVLVANAAMLTGRGAD